MNKYDETPPRRPGETAIYEDDPFELGEIDEANFVTVKDFLPRPQDLVFKQSKPATEKVSMSFDKRASEKKHLEITILQYVLGRRDEAKANFDQVVEELAWYLPNQAYVFVGHQPSFTAIENGPAVGGGDEHLLTEIMVSFLQDSSVVIGVISAAYKVISKLIEKERDIEVTIEVDNRKITIKGPKIGELEEFISEIMPTLAAEKIKPAQSRLENLGAEAKVKENWKKNSSQ